MAVERHISEKPLKTIFSTALQQAESVPHRLEQVKIRRFHAIMLISRAPHRLGQRIGPVWRLPLSNGAVVPILRRKQRLLSFEDCVQLCFNPQGESLPSNQPQCSRVLNRAAAFEAVVFEREGG